MRLIEEARNERMDKEALIHLCNGML